MPPHTLTQINESLRICEDCIWLTDSALLDYKLISSFLPILIIEIEVSEALALKVVMHSKRWAIS